MKHFSKFLAWYSVVSYFFFFKEKVLILLQIDKISYSWIEVDDQIGHFAAISWSGSSKQEACTCHDVQVELMTNCSWFYKGTDTTVGWSVYIVHHHTPCLPSAHMADWVSRNNGVRKTSWHVIKIWKNHLWLDTTFIAYLQTEFARMYNWKQMTWFGVISLLRG